MQDIIIKTIDEREALAKNFAEMVRVFGLLDSLTAHIYNKRIYKKLADELFESKKDNFSDLEKNLLIDYREYLSADIKDKGEEIIDIFTEFLRNNDFKIYLQMIPQNYRYSVFFTLVLEEISKGTEISFKKIINTYIERTENCSDEEILNLMVHSKKIAINRERELKKMYDKHNVSYIYRSFADCLDDEPEIIEKEEVEFTEEINKTFKDKFKDLFKNNQFNQKRHK
jgi:Mn-dependent DtxR family transcriptional regulator